MKKTRPLLAVLRELAWLQALQGFLVFLALPWHQAALAHLAAPACIESRRGAFVAAVQWLVRTSVAALPSTVEGGTLRAEP